MNRVVTPPADLDAILDGTVETTTSAQVETQVFGEAKGNDCLQGVQAVKELTPEEWKMVHDLDELPPAEAATVATLVDPDAPREAPAPAPKPVATPAAAALTPAEAAILATLVDPDPPSDCDADIAKTKAERQLLGTILSPSPVVASLAAFLRFRVGDGEGTQHIGIMHGAREPLARIISKNWQQFQAVPDHALMVEEIGKEKNPDKRATQLNELEQCEHFRVKANFAAWRAKAVSYLEGRIAHAGLVVVMDASHKNKSGLAALKPFMDAIGQLRQGSSEKDRFHGLKWWRAHLTHKPWLIKNWLRLGDTVVLWGKTGCCKSFIALGMALSIVHRLPFAGEPVHPGAVFYIYTESVEGCIKRTDAWKKEHGITEDHDDLYLTQCRYDLNDGAACGQQIVDDIRKEAGNKPVMLVILDTLSKMFSGDENTADMAHVEQAMAFIKDALGCTVICVHHTGKDQSKEERGHISLRSNVDASIGCKLIGDDNGIDLEGDMRAIEVWNPKAKEDLGGRKTIFERKLIKLGEAVDEYTGHEDITSLVMVPSTGAAIAAKEKDAKAAKLGRDLELICAYLPKEQEKAISKADWQAAVGDAQNMGATKFKELVALGIQKGWVGQVLGNRRPDNPNRFYLTMIGQLKGVTGP